MRPVYRGRTAGKNLSVSGTEITQLTVHLIELKFLYVSVFLYIQFLYTVCIY